MDKKNWSMETVPINGPDDLREATRGADLEIVQLRPEKLTGSIRHIGVGNLWNQHGTVQLRKSSERNHASRESCTWDTTR
jgi:hypothetical protein